MHVGSQFADFHPHAQKHLPPGTDADIGATANVLYAERSSDRGLHAGKLDQHAIAQALDKAPGMVRQHLFLDVFHDAAPSRHRVTFVFFYEPDRFDQIDYQHRSNDPFDAARALKTLGNHGSVIYFSFRAFSSKSPVFDRGSAIYPTVQFCG